MQYFLGIVFFTQLWSPPENMSIAGADDIKPQACRMRTLYTCLVWQTNINGNWDIFSRFETAYDWTDTIRITTDIASDINPSVATEDEDNHYYWCAWQNNSAGNWDIYIAYNETYNTWQVPFYQLTNDSVDDEYPSVCIINDTVWVVWQKRANGAVNIFSSYFDGALWSSPIAITNDSLSNNIHPKINIRGSHPFTVWEKDADIYYSEYSGGIWQVPQPIAPDPADDNSPEIATGPYHLWVWVVWQSNRDGNYEIYSTGRDSFDVYHRLTYSDSADVSPSPLNLYPSDKPSIAFSTNRKGNSDIYSIIRGPYHDTTCFIDSNPAEDILPVMTTTNQFDVWALWQTNRNGDWDIYGSWFRYDAIEENNYTGQLSGTFRTYPNPFFDHVTFEFRILNYDAQAMLKIFDVTGRLIKSFNHLTNLQCSQLVWDGRDASGRQLPPGVYFYQLKAGNLMISEKVIKL